MGPVIQGYWRIGGVETPAIFDGGSPVNIVSTQHVNKIAETQPNIWNKAKIVKNTTVKTYCGTRLNIQKYIVLALDIGQKSVDTPFLIDANEKGRIIIGTKAMEHLGTVMFVPGTNAIWAMKAGSFLQPPSISVDPERTEAEPRPKSKRKHVISCRTH